MPGRSLILTLTALLTLTWAVAAHAAENGEVCAVETARQEAQQQIPRGLLHAIALVESGRWDSDRRESFAWPWTIMAEGEGRFLPTKAAAIAEVKKLQARGVKNIDVGCMQVNLQAHKTAFRDLDEAFEPASNVAYAARFLVGLYESTNNWATAGAYYHSQTPSLAAEYKSKLLAVWKKQGGDSSVRTASAENHPPLGMGFKLASTAETPKPQARDERLVRQLADAHQQSVERSAAERAEAKRIADAYRQARLEEYRLRHQQGPAKG